MRHANRPRLLALLAMLSAAVAQAHPPEANGHHDAAGHSHADQSTARLWTNTKTGETVRGAYLATRDGRIAIERENGDRVIFFIADLAPADRAEAERRAAGVQAINAPKADPPKSAAPTPAAVPGQPPQAVPFAFFAPAVATRWDDRWLYVESDGLPHEPFAHPMMVGIRSWQQQVPVPHPFRGANAWQIPLKPELAPEPISGRTQLRRGAVALAVNGVPIFNALNNRGDDAFLAGELDEFGGHSGRADDYHYHTAPLGLQRVVGAGNPIAYALDGFPIYGLFEPTATKGTEKACPLGGTEPLDELNGHFAENQGLYHYHASLTFPYINGGMRGVVEVERDQVEPQPQMQPMRPAGKPLRGATITGFKAEGDNAWALEYDLAGETYRLAYRREADGGYTFEKTEPDGSQESETFEVRDEPRGRPLKRDSWWSGWGWGDPPPPPEVRDEADRRPPRPDDGPRAQAVEEEVDPNFKAAEGFTLTSSAVGADGRLPATFTCDGDSVSPPLQWTAAPPGTKSLALVMHHTPGPGDTHVYLVLFGIPPTTTSLAQGATDVGQWGINTVNGGREYAPPCSKGPGDKKYTLTLYALSAVPALDSAKTRVTRSMLLEAIQGTVLGAAKLDVVYARSGGGGNRQPPRRR